VRADFLTLAALQRAQVQAIPFENLDVQLGRPVVLEPEAAFEKVVERRRGGWCYELNGLLGWALGELGFDVARVAGGVLRERDGDGVLGNHLALLVQLEGQRWLLDVGFGGSLAAPMPLRVLERDDAPFRLGLREADGYWRFTESDGGDAFSFDFKPEPADEALLQRQCLALQTEAKSPFVQNLVVQRRDADAHIALRGRVVTTLRAGERVKRVLDTAEQLVEELSQTFGLELPEVAGLWPKICARHAARFGA
jgi:N-hydroxyarylamine O-acetyltransferase